MLITLSSDVIIIDHGLGQEGIAIMKRVALLHRDTLRVVIGGDPADTEMLRESGVVHHHVASLDPETLIPLLRGDQDEDDGVRAGEPEGIEVDGEEAG
jgi:hypothetical protein